MLKKVALESQTGHWFPPRCGQALLACSYTTMRIVANIWAACTIQTIPLAVQIKASNVFSIYFSIQSIS